jgi:hypothetical protein
MFPVYGGKFLSRKAVQTGCQMFRWWRRGWNGGAEVAETTVRRLIYYGFRRIYKEIGQESQCWWRICREIKFFPGFISIYDIVTDSPSYQSARNGLPPAFTLVSSSTYSNLKLEAICSSETSWDLQRTIWRYIPDDSTVHNHGWENLRSYTYQKAFTVTLAYTHRGNISTERTYCGADIWRSGWWSVMRHRSHDVISPEEYTQD